MCCVLTRGACREPPKRLGSKSGAAELKKCEFLVDVKWDNIRKMTPPYVAASFYYNVTSLPDCV